MGIEDSGNPQVFLTWEQCGCRSPGGDGDEGRQEGGFLWKELGGLGNTGHHNTHPTELLFLKIFFILEKVRHAERREQGPEPPRALSFTISNVCPSFSSPKLTLLFITVEATYFLFRG